MGRHFWLFTKRGKQCRSYLVSHVFKVVYISMHVSSKTYLLYVLLTLLKVKGGKR